MTNNKKKPLKWVIMIYSCANDKNSEEGMVNFFKELNELGKEIDKKKDNEEIKILLHAYCDWDESKKRKYYAKRFEIKNDFLKTGKADKDVVYTKLYTNMGDPNALSDFIVWCKKNYEANHYLLLLWGHGAQHGMFNGQLTKASTVLKKTYRFKMYSDEKLIPYVNAIKPVKKTIAEQYGKPQEIRIQYPKNRNGLVETDIIDRKIINNGTEKIEPNKKVLPPTVIYYFDVEKYDRAERLKQLIPVTHTKDSLTIEEICKSLWDTGHYIKNPGNKNPGNIEVVMLFGCAMQTFELAYELSKCGKLGCKYLIASEELIYWEGYDYKTSFLRLLNNPGMEAEELCIHIVTDTRDKKANEKNKDDGHHDKPAWAISCVNIKRAGHAAKLIDGVSKKLLDLSLHELYAASVGKRNIIKSYLQWEYWETLLNARVSCHHFGEAAFYDCYIDLIWFYKNLKATLKKDIVKNDPYGNKVIHDSPIVLSRYRKITKELGKIIKYLDKKFIVERFIGERRGEKAIWEKTIQYKKLRERKIKSSTGGHGVNIFFPVSKYINKVYTADKYFLDSTSDYNLEFNAAFNKQMEKLNKQMKKRKIKPITKLQKKKLNGLQRKAMNWHLMILEYILRNRRTRAQLSKGKRFLNIERNAEPTNRKELMNLISSAIP